MFMVGVAQLVEPRIVIPVVVGSSPIVHPTSLCTARAVLGRAGRSNSFWAVSSVGRAGDS